MTIIVDENAQWYVNGTVRSLPGTRLGTVSWSDKHIEQLVLFYSNGHWG